MYRTCIKSVLDVVVASLALLGLSPLMLITALAIRSEDRGPASFRQQRVGRDGTRFRVVKFRSMPTGTKDVPSADAGAATITRVGRVIRRTNIDELPQLINVFRGEMSLVGPRPALPAQETLLTLREASGAMRCKPGLTGLAQIHAYDGMSEEAKAEWDGAYAADISFANDVSIVFKTFRYLVRRPPVY